MDEHYKSAQSFMEELATNPPKLPYDPALLSELFQMTADDANFSMSTIAAVIERGPGLAAKILSLANSVRYSLLSKVSSVANAVSVLGLIEVRNLVVMLGASAIVQHAKLPEAFSLRKLWEHQLTTGECSRSISNLLKIINSPFKCPAPDEAYTAALLHDLGKLMIAYMRPADWNAINALKKAEGLTSAEAEDKYWGIDHGSIAGRLLHAWELPDSLTEPISYHHAPDLAGPYKNAAILLNVSDSLALYGQKVLEVWQQGESPDSVLPPQTLQYIEEMGLNLEIILPSMAEAFENNEHLSIAGLL